MEHEAYQEYFRTKANKVSLAAWILINNNVIFQNPFIFLNVIDFTIQTLVTLALFDYVGCVAPLSTGLLEIVFYNNAIILTYINLGISSVLIATMTLIALLILRDLSWQSYAQKRIPYQILSSIVTLFRGPFFGLTITLIYGSMETSQQLQQTYLRFISLFCSILSLMILFIYTYIGSIFFNLASPTKIIPWGDNSPKHYQLGCLIKIAFLLTVKLRSISNVLMYSLAFLTLLILIYKVYIMLAKTHITNVALLKFMILTDFAQIHLLICFLITMLSNNQSAFMYYILPFLPATCLFGFYFNDYCMRMRFSSLIDLEGRSQTEKSLVYRYLIQIFQEEIEEDNHIYELQRLQQIHLVKCDNYLDTMKRKMRQKAIVFEDQNTPLMIDDIRLIDQGEDNEQPGYSKNAQLQEYPEESMSSADKNSYSKISINTQKDNNFSKKSPSEEQFTRKFQKQNPVIEIREASFGDYELTTPNTFSGINIESLSHQKSMLNENEQKDNDKQHALSELSNVKFIQKASDTNQFKLMKNDITASLRNQVNAKQQNQSFKKYRFQKDSKQLSSTSKQDSLHGRKIGKNNMFPGSNINRGGNALQYGEFEYRDYESNNRKEGLKKLVDHYFKYHLSNPSEMNFQLKLIKIYYTFKIMNNPYLAHFLLFSLKDNEHQDIGFIDTNVQLINQRYIEEIISLQAQQDEVEDSKIVKGKLDLEKMLRVNQTVAEFDNSIEQTSINIHEFWSCLLNQRETDKLFTKGIKISKQLCHVQELIDEIQSSQGEQDLNVYLKMAQFYSNVLFKSNESGQMQYKARQHFQNMKVNKLTYQRGAASQFGDNDSDDQEKCLLMAEINLKKPMKITFINKAALRVTQYNQAEVLKLSINYLMPQFIGEIHQLFIDQFLRTGKSRMIKNQTENYVKVGNGTLLPVLTYLFINSLSNKHMILMFEPNRKLKVFDDPHSDAPFTFMITDNDFKVGEIAQNFEFLTGIGVRSFQNMRDERDRAIICDDIIRITTYDCGVKEFKEDFEPQEVDVVFHSIQRNEIHLLQDQNSSEQAILGNQWASPDYTGDYQLSSAYKVKLHQSIDESSLALKTPLENKEIVFVMKIIKLKLLGGKFKLNLLAFRRKPMENAKANILKNLINPARLGINNVSSNVDAQKEQHKEAYGIQSQTSKVQFGSEDSNQLNGPSNDGHYELDIQSQSSSVSQSSNSSTNYQIVTTYTQQVNSEATPKTLKFIMNIFLVMMIVMAIASSVVLSISLQNLSFALTSLTVCKHSYQAMDELTTLRFLLRSVVNIYQGNEPYANNYIKDRATIFEDLMLNVNTEMKKDQIIVTSLGETTTDGIQIASLNIPTFFMSGEGEFYSLNQSINQGLTLLHNKIIDVITHPDRREILGKSQLVYLNINVAAQKMQPSFKNMSIIERDTFLIINNTNGNLYEELNSFGPKFSDYQLYKIKYQSGYLTGVCLGMMAGILISAFIVIPLFGRIQHRILELMKIFFSIDSALKKSILDRIKVFQQMYLSKNDKSGLNTRAMELQEEEEKEEDFNNSNKGKKQIQKKEVPVSKLMQVEVINVDKKSLKKTKKHNKKVKYAFGIKNRKEALEDIMKDEDEEKAQDSKRTKGKKEDSSSSDNESEKETQKKKKIERSQQLKMEEFKIDQGQEKSEIQEFSKFTLRRKIIQGLVIIGLLSFMSSYFLIKFMLSTRMYSKIESSVGDLKIIFDRLSCSQNVLNFYTESYFIVGGGGTAQARSVLLDKHFNDLQIEIDHCMLMENKFQREVITSPQDYLTHAIEVLQTTEQGKVCVNTTLDKEVCIGLSEQVQKQGIMTFFFNIFKQVKQMELDLKNSIKMNTYNSTFARNQIKTRISHYIDTMMLVLYPIQIETQNAAHNSVYGYFQSNQTVFSLIYGSFLAATIVISIVFISNIYNKLRREMLLSNKLLYIIDFESINESERNVILKFLQHY